jgi:hypothetical protein
MWPDISSSRLFERDVFRASGCLTESRGARRQQALPIVLPVYAPFVPRELGEERLDASPIRERAGCVTDATLDEQPATVTVSVVADDADR